MVPFAVRLAATSVAVSLHLRNDKKNKNAGTCPACQMVSRYICKFLARS